MTRFAPLWQQAGSYPSQLDRGLLSALWPAGGGAGPPPAAVANTMNVTIPPGWLGVPLQAGQGSALCRWDANEVVTLAASPQTGQQRWDLVICQVRDNQIDGGPNNDFIFTNVTGVAAASSPAVPALPMNAALVAQVLLTGGQANLNSATFFDQRPLGHAEVFNATAYTIPATTFQNLHLDTVEGGAGFNTAFYAYSVPMPGRYLITALVSLDRVASGTLQVNKNGNPARRLNAPISGTTTGNPSFGGAAILPCVAGDALTLSVFTSVAANTLSGSPYTYAQFHYLGA
jgi:hypothetical protein